MEQSELDPIADPTQWLGVQRDLNAFPQERVQVMERGPGSLRYHIAEYAERPAGADGHLAHEIALLQGEAVKYDPESPVAERIRMAIHVRESAFAALEAHDNNPQAALRALKAERRQAVKANNYTAIDHTDREIGAIKRAKSTFYAGPEEIVRRVANPFFGRGRDPLYGERGAIRSVAGFALKGVFLGTYPFSSNELFDGYMDTFIAGFRPNVMAWREQRRRRSAAQSIASRAVRMRTVH